MAATCSNCNWQRGPLLKACTGAASLPKQAEADERPPASSPRPRMICCRPPAAALVFSRLLALSWPTARARHALHAPPPAPAPQRVVGQRALAVACLLPRAMYWHATSFLARQELCPARQTVVGLQALMVSHTGQPTFSCPWHCIELKTTAWPPSRGRAPTRSQGGQDGAQLLSGLLGGGGGGALPAYSACRHRPAAQRSMLNRGAGLQGQQLTGHRAAGEAAGLAALLGRAQCVQALQAEPFSARLGAGPSSPIPPAASAQECRICPREARQPRPTCQSLLHSAAVRPYSSADEHSTRETGHMVSPTCQSPGLGTDPAAPPGCWPPRPCRAAGATGQLLYGAARQHGLPVDGASRLAAAQWQ